MSLYNNIIIKTTTDNGQKKEKTLFLWILFLVMILLILFHILDIVSFEYEMDNLQHHFLLWDATYLVDYLAIILRFGLKMYLKLTYFIIRSNI